ncbi:MAG: hypothetical protein PVF58_13095 [Candidatus Methanofastidiosia archaeon]|jgi:hypothetical protein
MSIDMYVLGLLTFKNGKIVFSEKELIRISKEIGDCLPKEAKMDGWHMYTIDPERLHIEKLIKVKINFIRLGYCHHRVIVHFNMDYVRYPVFREDRKVLKEEADRIINECVKKKINDLINCEKRKNKEKREISEEFVKGGEVKFVYTYPLLIIKKKYKKDKTVPFSGENTSLSFEVVDLKWFPLLDRRHMMTITIPNTILYVQGEVGRDLLRDIVNAIYQYCLYEKKAKDERKKLIDWKNGPFENIVDEDLLVNLWAYFLDTMGGRTTDIRIIKITSKTFLIAFLTFLVSIITLVVTLLR